MNMNATMNASSSFVPSPDLSLEFRIVKISIYVVIFVLTIIGNVLVITVIRHDSRMRSSSHILIFNLAVCDLITPTISLPFDLAYEELHNRWHFGSTMCKILWPAQTFSATSSALILTAICIDRYRALVFPFKVRWAGKFCLMMCTIYALSIVVVVPYILVLRQEGGGEVFDCVEQWPNPQKKFRQAYTIVLFLLQYALPLVLMITLYSITLKSLYDSSKSLPGMVAGDESTACDRSNPEAEKRIHALKEQRKEQHLKVTKMFITVVIVFAISMFPNQVFWLWVDFGNLIGNRYFSMTSIICRIFTYSNSVLNPLIYGLYSKEFRKGYKTAGRRISNVHRQTTFYFPQGKKGVNNFQSLSMQASYNESQCKLIGSVYRNESTHQTNMRLKRVHFSTNSMNGNTKNTDQTSIELSQIIKNDQENTQERDHCLDFNSNATETTQYNPIEKGLHDNSFSKQEPFLGDNGLDKSVSDYLDELRESTC